MIMNHLIAEKKIKSCMCLPREKVIIESNFTALTDEPCSLVVWTLIHHHRAPGVSKPGFEAQAF